MILAVIGIVLAVLALVLAIPAFRRERASTSVEAFRSQRRAMSAHRPEYTSAAASLFADDLHLEGTNYISPRVWRLPHPVPLDDVVVTFVQHRKRPTVTGRSRNALRLLPTPSGGSRAVSYSQVITSDAELRPGLWWDATSYDLLSFIPDNGRVAILCSAAQYFDMVDVCEAVGHEFVARQRDLDHVNTRSLRLREEIEDVFDICRRPFIPAIPTLVLLRPSQGPPTFLLHSRDTSAVASASGTLHVFGGQFQPSSRHSVDMESEADLWLAVARELAEEMLGAAHADGSAGGRLMLDDEPLSSLEELRSGGLLRVWLLGMGLDPLTLWPDLLTVAVIDEDAFRQRFPILPTANPEGVIVGVSTTGREVRGFSFEAPTVDRLTATKEIHPAAAACIRLAWRHRDALLGPTPRPGP